MIASVEQTCPWIDDIPDHEADYQQHRSAADGFPPQQASREHVNVGSGERFISLAAGSLLSLLGLERRDGIGFAIAGLGGAMLYRGLTGRCYLYQVLDATRSHWVAEAPWIVGGQVAWDAEMVADEPQSKIAWRSLPGSTVEHHGSVTFTKAPGNRGTTVRVEMKYLPPVGKLGQWISKLFGDAPEQQVREDLRNFKRLMEVGEIPTVAGQPRGLCNR